MVSAQAKAVVKFYRKTSTGSMIFLYGNDLAALGPSGSSDGSIASTPEKWGFIPMQSAQNKVLRVNDQLVVTITPKVGFTSDGSDGEAVIPITFQDGSVTTLSGFENTTDWDVQQLGDVALLADVESVIAAKKILQPFALGSNISKAFVSIEDNA